MAHPDLQAEQAFIDHAYDRLEAMRAAASTMLYDAFSSGGGTPQAVTERDVSVRTSLARLEHLQLGDESLVFGRIDTTAGPDGPRGEAFHIGRLAVSDADQEALVVDWRAPVAEPFYRATGRHPMGLRRRRHFLTHGRYIQDLEDELFGGEGPEAALGVGGSTVLLAALERSRSGRMRDIVATVQREQDEVIRAPLAGVLVVQGGPGTGKTAVALHRAAYLLYTFRFPLERQGVLVVGPNPLYLRYIERVLPSLGETGVELSTVGGLVHGVPVTGVDGPVSARVKGDARMAVVLAKAVADRQRPLPRDVEVGVGPYVLRITVADSAGIVAAAKRRPGTHNSRRRYVETQVTRRLAARLDEAEERARRAGLRPEPEGGEQRESRDEVELGRQLRRDPIIVEELQRMWPALAPMELLHDLFGARPLIDLAGKRVLDDAERATLFRARSADLADVAWTDADLALLDEARALLGPLPRRRGTDPADLRTFGHIVVDEAQDLSPMQLRMLSRRSLSGSMTVVGDIAQATGAFAPSHWDEILTHLPIRRGLTQVELSVNYRTPAEIMAVAGRVLDAAAPHTRLPESVRSTGEEPTIVTSPPGDLASTVARAAAAEAAAVDGGTVAVVAPRSMVPGLAAGLMAAGIDFEQGVRAGLAATVTLLPLEVVKGLEFDAVVVVEPSRLVREATQGLRSLYVALTRPTKRLTLVHEEPLPAFLLPVPHVGLPA